MIKIPTFIYIYFKEYHALYPYRLPILRRIYTILLDKSFAEGRHIIKSDHFANLRNSIFLLQDQLSRPLDTDTSRQFQNTAIGESFYLAVKCRDTHTHFIRQEFCIEARIFQMLFNGLHDLIHKCISCDFYLVERSRYFDRKSFCIRNRLRIECPHLFAAF